MLAQGRAPSLQVVGDSDLAQSREMHPNDTLPLSKRQCVAHWDNLELEPVLQSHNEPLR